MTESRFDLLVTGKIPPELRAVLEADYDLFDRAMLAADQIARFEVAVTTSMDGMGGETMAMLPNLKLLACNGAGLERIALEDAARRGIEICNTPDAVTTDTADFALALIFACSRRLVEADRFVRSGAWTESKMTPSTRVRDKRLGVVGLGKIGATLAARATAIGLKVAYCARSERLDNGYSYVADVADLAEWSDYLVLACTGGEETRGLVGQEVLHRLGDTGYLINISRGSVVDEAALIHALETRTIAGAALDVFENEPRISPAFAALDNVILTPHVAAVTHETRADMAAHLRAAIASYVLRR